MSIRRGFLVGPAALVLALLVSAAPADAIRVDSNNRERDVCRNRGVHGVPGKQVLADIASGRWELTGKPNRRGRYVCLPGWRQDLMDSKG